MEQDASDKSSSRSRFSTAATLPTVEAQSAIWPLILQQDSIKKDMRTVCALLCSSRALRAEISTASAGQLDCCIGTPPCKLSLDSRCSSPGNQYDHLAHWISKHGALLRSLDVSRAANWHRAFQVEAVLAAALASAAGPPEPAASGITAGPGSQAASISSPTASEPVTPPGSACTGGASASHPQQCRLLLQEVSGCWAKSAAVLQHLPARHLTKLTFGYRSDDEAVKEAAGLALARLTALQELDISSKSMDLSQYDVAAVAQLTNLQKLKLPSLLFSGPLSPEWLPRQLQELHLPSFGLFRSGDVPSERDGEHDSEQDEEQGGDGCLQLGQLTALTRLQLSRRVYIDPDQLLVWRGDVLPPNLVVLDAQLGSLQPVLKLQHLQQLKLTLPSSWYGHVDLLQLTQLQALTDLGLDYMLNYACVDASLWSLLPIKHLAFGSGDASTLQALAQLQDLTSLQLGGLFDKKPCEFSVSYGKLAAALQQLTALQKLWWKDVEASDGDLWGWHDELGTDEGTDNGNNDDRHSGCSGSEDMRYPDPASVLLQVIANKSLCSLTLVGTPFEHDCPILMLKATTGLTHLDLCRCGMRSGDYKLLKQHLTALQPLEYDWH